MKRIAMSRTEQNDRDRACSGLIQIRRAVLADFKHARHIYFNGLLENGPKFYKNKVLKSFKIQVGYCRRYKYVLHTKYIFLRSKL